ncbi:MAG: SpoIIE family protein phosphatase [Phycisphaerae bacterium]|nr:SpoIIE family protein phosphatase [Phycisphaerae bacterium]
MMKQSDQAKRIADLELMLQITRSLGAATELQKLLEVIVEAGMRMLDAERGSVFLYDSDAKELFSVVATGAAGIRFSIEKGIAGAAARSMQVINVPDAYADERFNQEIDRKTGFRTRNILSCPLTGYDGELTGVLQLLNKKQGPFTSYDQQLAEALGSQAGVALQRARLIEHYIEKQRMSRDLEIAKDIQHNLLPHEDPSVDGYEIASAFEPCDETGGDCYDFLLLPQDRLVFMLGDATGHGVGPALVSAETRALLRSAASLTNDIEKIIKLVNSLLAQDLPGNRFTTAFLGIIDTVRHNLVYASAGQGPVLFYQADGAEVSQLEVTGIPLGIMADFEYDVAQPRPLAKGDIIMLLTDGFYEWTDPSGELFGADRAGKILRDNASKPAGQILQAIREAVRNFAQGTRQTDDLTAIIIKRD